MGNFEWGNGGRGNGERPNGARKGHRANWRGGGGASIMGDPFPPPAHPSIDLFATLPIPPFPPYPLFDHSPQTTIFIRFQPPKCPNPKMLATKFSPKSRFFLSLFLTFFLFNFCLSAIQLPFGVEEGDEQLQFADGPLVRRDLVGQFSFFERPFSSIFIAQNGAISFGVPFDPNANELDLERKDIIAVFFAPSTGGRTFYRSADETNLLAKELSAKIRRAFSASEFEADSVILVTWDELANEGQGNTFQLALAANQNQTYALLVYSTIKWTKGAEGRWAQAGFFSSDGRSEKLLNSGGPSIGDVIKVTNFNEPGMFIYRVSGAHPIDPRFGQPKMGANEEYEYQQEQSEYDQEDQIAECPPDPFRDNCPPNCNLVLDDNHCSLCICSSVVSENLAGTSYSKLSNELGPAIRPPRLLPAPLRMPDLSCTPQQGRAQCHQNANCLQYRAGYCCECENGFTGNGVECIARDGPLRINGQFEAALNGKMVQKTDLFSYIQPQEGQQHTALAKIQSEIGWSLLLLDSLSNPFGWLFARGNGQNGFQLTGGNFTRIVNIHLGERYALVIRQEFADRQFADHFAVNVFVSGTLPDLQGPIHVSIPEFEETYRRERPGLIRAYSERFILLRDGGDGGPGEEKKYRITSDQQIHFTECPFRESTGPNQMVVRFERLNANFNEAENVVRFASQSNILGAEASSRGEGQEDAGERRGQTQDACSSGRHFCTLPNMVCVPIPINPGYRCECRPGFRLIEDNNVEQRMVCQQQNEVGPEEQQQLENILLPAPTIQPAILQPGECARHDQCHQWGECVFGPIPGYPGKCKCRGWYVGDGVQHCGPPEQPPPSAIQPPPQTQSRPSGTMCRHESECGDNAGCKYSEQHGFYVCRCNDGWRGDGIDCLAEAEPAEEDGGQRPPGDEGQGGVGGMTLQKQPGEVPIARKHCTDHTECHPLFGSCILSEQTNAHFCVCLPGYQGDGVEKCEKSEECSPTDPAQGCAEPNQECQFQHSLQKFTCQCRNGFLKQPDGNCAFEFDKSSQCQQCGPNAQCIRGEGGNWNCICNAGFMGNGMECRREANCLDEPRMCSPNAQCLPGGQKAYLCVCNYGYGGDGRTCEAIVQKANEAESLLIGRGMAIIKRPLAQSTDLGGKQLIVQPHQIVVDIEFDCQNERIYWSDISGHSIRSAFLNGTEISQQFGDILRAPEGIAIDWRSRNIYYLDSIKNELGVLSADGKFQRSLLKEGLNNPRALVIDLEGRQLFYSDWSREGPKIGRIGLDGSANRVFVSDDVHLPNGLVLLQQRRWLCWVDAGNQRLSCIGLDGTGRRVIYAPLEYPFGLTVDNQEERFYWTDWKDHKIHSVDVFGKGHMEFLPGAGGRGKLYGVLSLPVKCQPHLAPSECSQIEKGGCAHWCLPGVSAGSVTCVCPENVHGLDQC